MGKSYLEKLKDPRWQKKRLQILERDEFTCSICCSSEKELHVHHKEYIYGNDPWDYNDNYLVTLCADCHKDEEYYKEELSGIIHDMRLMGFSNSSIYSILQQYVNDNKENIKIAYGQP